jgi:rRNA maturation protein Rpf1
VIEQARELRSDGVLIVERWKGGPGRLQLQPTPFIPRTSTTLDLRGVRTQREIGRRTVVKRGLAVTIAHDGSEQLRQLALVFAQFLKVPLVDEPHNLECKASVHFTPMREHDLRVAFTMPPREREIGPILIVRLHHQPLTECFSR